MPITQPGEIYADVRLDLIKFLSSCDVGAELTADEFASSIAYDSQVIHFEHFPDNDEHASLDYIVDCADDIARIAPYIDSCEYFSLYDDSRSYLPVDPFVEPCFYLRRLRTCIAYIIMSETIDGCLSWGDEPDKTHIITDRHISVLTAWLDESKWNIPEAIS